MKRYGYIYEQVCSMNNIREAHKNARKHKTWYGEVKMIDANPQPYFDALQKSLIEHTYHTSNYQIFKRVEGRKEREIYKLPYYPDRICQWSIMQIIEPYLLRYMTKDTYSSIPKRGIHKCLSEVEKAMRGDIYNCQYCLKLDIVKLYPSIDHDVLKGIYRRLFKDKELLWLIDEIIDSTPGKGIPIGNYISQYSANLYMSPFDHWIKEQKHVKHYFRYMDDMVIFSHSKDELHSLMKEIDEFFTKKMKLQIKPNWQIFPSYKRGLDFVGYRVFMDYTLLRKTTCLNMKRKFMNINKRRLEGKSLRYGEWCSVYSYLGWLKYCNSYRLIKKYYEPILVYCEAYYKYHVKIFKSPHDNIRKG